MGLQRDGAGALGDLGGGLLGRRDDEDLRGGDELGHGDGDVAGAGRQVEQQHVEVAPEDVAEELLQRPVEHRAAPDHGWLPGTNMPIEMTFTSWLMGGRIMSSTWVGRCCTPSMRGTEKP